MPSNPPPSSQPPVITRFAPSPTGHLHIGGARTALLCWAFAKRSGGHFLIRIEDTDAARSSEESARGILEDLAWLGLHWDEGPTYTVVRAFQPVHPGSAASNQTIGGDPRGVAPFHQSQRIDTYNRYIDQLARAGLAYPAFETADELDARRKAANAAKRTYQYERPADVIPGQYSEARWARAGAGETHVVRIVSPRETVTVQDQVLGDKQFPADAVDDFVIRKADGLPTYHFAVVVDDELMGVTHVLRAQEHLQNTPRHIVLQRALGFRTPRYAHMPLIFNMDGTKMSKRDKAKAARQALQEQMKKDPALTAAAAAARLGLDETLVAGFLAKENDSLEVAERVAEQSGVALPEIEVSDFREAGYLPEAITNFLALLGWNPGQKTADGKDLEKFDMDFLAANFSLERIGRTNAKFDRKKLLSFNADAIAAMSDADFARRWIDWLTAYGPADLARTLADWQTRADQRLTWLVRAVKSRAKTFRDALRPCDFMLRADDATSFDAAAVEKNLLANDRAGAKVLAEFKDTLARIDPFEPEAINAAVESFAIDRGLGMGQIAQPIRVAIAGVPVSPPLGETLAILGRESVAARIGQCLAIVGDR